MQSVTTTSTDRTHQVEQHHAPRLGVGEEALKAVLDGVPGSISRVCWCLFVCLHPGKKRRRPTKQTDSIRDSPLVEVAGDGHPLVAVDGVEDDDLYILIYAGIDKGDGRKSEGDAKTSHPQHAWHESEHRQGDSRTLTCKSSMGSQSRVASSPAVSAYFHLHV